jgi:Transmembrane protein 43
MSDSYSRVTSKSWGDRLVESIKGVLIGILLFLVSFPVLFWNEGRAVHRAATLAEGKSSVVDVDSGKVDPADDGKLVHLTGDATTKDVLRDETFGVEANALRLTRTVEMYQWIQEKKEEKQKQLGGGEKTVTTYNYKTEWSDKLHDSSTFEKPAGHENPEAKPYRDDVWKAKEVKLGAYDLPESLTDTIRKEDPLPATTDMLNKLPKETQKKMHVTSDGLFHEGEDPSNPEVGDARIKFTVVKQPQMVSVIAKQVKNTLEPYKTQAGGDQNTIYRLELGQVSADEMFAHEEQENTMLTWALRLVGFLLMAIGLYLVFRPVATVADVVPFFGNLLSAGAGVFAAVIALVLSLITIGIGWLYYRPLLGIGLLAVAALLFIGLFLLGRSRRSAALPRAS